MGQWRALADIPATTQAPGAARALVGTLVSVWGLADLRQTAELVISEIVTNAYRHAPGTDSFELEVVRRGDGVRMSLADGSSIRPMVAELDDARPSGRGMRIVEALTSRWGADDHHGGKRVWVDIDREMPEPVVSGQSGSGEPVLPVLDNGVLVLPLSGSVDLSTAEHVRTVAMAAVNTSGVQTVMLDLAAVTFLDSSGIGALFEIHHAATLLGTVSVRLVNVPSGVRRVLQIAGFGDTFGLD